MELEIGKKKYKLAFTFNSFRYMEELDFTELEDVESKPFKMIGFTEKLLLGALNSNPKVQYSIQDAMSILENYVDGGGNLVELIEDLTNMLEESHFFKNLQVSKK